MSTATLNQKLETVAVGMPCYNRPELLDLALLSLRAQTYTAIKILISDNASPDPRVAEIARRHAAQDARISYVRQDQNIGMSANFAYVLRQSDAPYFMWAGDDDLWEPNFVECLMDLLNGAPQAQLAGSTVEYIDWSGIKRADIAGLSRFNSSPSRVEDAYRYVNESELLGKQNLFLGIFRSKSLKTLFDDVWNICASSKWGPDTIFLYAFIARHPIIATDRILLHKRVPILAGELMRKRVDAENYFVASKRFFPYLWRHMKVAPNYLAAATVGLQFLKLYLRKKRSQIRVAINHN
jgi:glycosyltransferase involved in cell wall biosynthesis